MLSDTSENIKSSLFDLPAPETPDLASIIISSKEMIPPSIKGIIDSKAAVG